MVPRLIKVREEKIRGIWRKYIQMFDWPCWCWQIQMFTQNILVSWLVDICWDFWYENKHKRLWYMFPTYRLKFEWIETFACCCLLFWQLHILDRSAYALDSQCITCVIRVIWNRAMKKMVMRMIMVMMRIKQTNIEKGIRGNVSVRQYGG